MNSISYNQLSSPGVRKDYVLKEVGRDGKLDFSLLRAPHVAMDASAFLQASEHEARARARGQGR